VRILVLGNSDTLGSALAPGEQPWPEIVRGRLAAWAGAEVQLEHRTLAPYGPRAVDHALKCVAETDPDLVVIILAGYTAVVGYVHLRVRQRFGARAERWYVRLERGFDRNTRRDGRETAVNNWSRRLVRKLLGTATYASLDEVASVYCDVLRRLSQREGVQVLVAGDARFGEARRALNPGLLTGLQQLHAAVRPVVAEHRFLFVDGEDGISGAPEREALFLPDAMHLNAAGHMAFASTVFDFLRGPSGLGPTPQLPTAGSFSGTSRPTGREP